MILQLADAKKYLKLELDYTDEDDDITSLILAAEEYLKNVGAVLKAESELAKLAIKKLVVHWHENREPVGEAEKLAGMQGIISQLKYCYPEVVT